LGCSSWKQMEPVVACSSQHLEGRPSHFAGTFRGTETGYNNLPYHNYTHACDAPRLQPIPFRCGGPFWREGLELGKSRSAGFGMEWIVPFPAISGAKHRLKPAQNACHWRWDWRRSLSILVVLDPSKVLHTVYRSLSLTSARQWLGSGSLSPGVLAYGARKGGQVQWRTCNQDISR
jgi:hypothetical protein